MASAAACGDPDPAEGQAGGTPGGQGSPGGAVGPGGGPGAGPGGGVTQPDGSPVVTDGSVLPGDASILPGIDGGVAIPVEPPKPILDASISGPPLGNAYAETEYNLERPAALVGAFSGLTLFAGETRLFVNELREGDAGAEVLYGAADLIDGGLVWQKPPARPRSFPVGVSSEGERSFVSPPFKYVLEARVPGLTANSVFRLYLEVAQTVWTATFSADYENIDTGALYGVVTRQEAEMRPLDAASCVSACGLLNGVTACSGDSLRLSTAFDCNGAELDADSDGDGTNDGYRLILSFKSRRTESPLD